MTNDENQNPEADVDSAEAQDEAVESETESGWKFEQPGPAPEGETPREFIERVTPVEPEPTVDKPDLFDPEKVDETPETDVEHQADEG